MSLEATTWAWNWTAHTTIPPAVRLVLVRVADWAHGGNGYAPYAQHDYLARCVGYSTGHVRRALDRLCEPVPVVDFGTEGEPLLRGEVVLLEKRERVRRPDGTQGPRRYAVNLSATPADFGCDVTHDGVLFGDATSAHGRAVDPEPARVGARTGARGRANRRASTRDQNLSNGKKPAAGPVDRPASGSPGPLNHGQHRPVDDVLDPAEPVDPERVQDELGAARRALAGAERPPVAAPLPDRTPDV